MKMPKSRFEINGRAETWPKTLGEINLGLENNWKCRNPA